MPLYRAHAKIRSKQTRLALCALCAIPVQPRIALFLLSENKSQSADAPNVAAQATQEGDATGRAQHDEHLAVESVSTGADLSELLARVEQQAPVFGRRYAKAFADASVPPLGPPVSGPAEVGLKLEPSVSRSGMRCPSMMPWIS